MKVLLIGSGGREHAMAWKLRKSRVIDTLYCWPGSISLETFTHPLALPANAPLSLVVSHAKEQGVNFIVVGPEQPLAEGIANIGREQHMPVFGPIKECALLESSKSFAKEVMFAAGIPTASYVLATSASSCRQYAEKLLSEGGGAVLKANGLAGGKGVFVCHNQSDLDLGLHRLFETDLIKASDAVVVEELLVGRECSFFSFIGNNNPTSLGFAVDFKRLHENDNGPNTGGMGCYTPVSWLPANATEEVNRLVVYPLLRELKRRNLDYTGCLYVGIMWTENGPRVIEFNVRLGDPEAQVLAIHDPRDWGGLIAAKLGFPVDTAEFSGSHDSGFGASVTVVMASGGYPYGENEPRPSSLPKTFFSNNDENFCVFGGALQQGDSDNYLTGKGRILAVSAHADNFSEARSIVYTQIKKIAALCPGVQFRSDIAATES